MPATAASCAIVARASPVRSVSAEQFAWGVSTLCRNPASHADLFDVRHPAEAFYHSQLITLTVTVANELVVWSLATTLIVTESPEP